MKLTQFISSIKKDGFREVTAHYLKTKGYTQTDIKRAIETKHLRWTYSEANLSAILKTTRTGDLSGFLTII